MQHAVSLRFCGTFQASLGGQKQIDLMKEPKNILWIFVMFYRCLNEEKEKLKIFLKKHFNFLKAICRMTDFFVAFYGYHPVMLALVSNKR